MPSCRIRPSPRSARRSAPAAATPRSTTAASTLRSSPASSATAWNRYSRGCGPTSPRSRASRSICRPRRTSPSAAESRKPSISTRLNDADPGELNHWAALFLDRIKTIPGITDVATDQLNAGPLLDITIKREVASSYGILPFTIDNTLDDAFGQRIVSTMLHDPEPVPCRRWRSTPSSSTRRKRSTASMSNPRAGQQVPLSTLVDSGGEGRAARGQPSGPVPVGDDLVQPRCRAPRSAKRSAPSSRLKKQLGKPLSLQTELSGQRPGIRRRRCRARRSSSPPRSSSSTSSSACCTRA